MGLLKKDAITWTRMLVQNFFCLIDNVISKNHTKSKRMLSIFKIDKTWQFSSYNFDKHKLAEIGILRHKHIHFSCLPQIQSD